LLLRNNGEELPELLQTLHNRTLIDMF